MAAVKVGKIVFLCTDAGDAEHGKARVVVPAIVIGNVNTLSDQDLRKLTPDQKKALAGDTRFKGDEGPHSGLWADLVVFDPDGKTPAEVKIQVYFGRDVGEFDDQE